MTLDELKLDTLYYKKNEDRDDGPGIFFFSLKEKKRTMDYIDFYGIEINNEYRDWTEDVLSVSEINVRYDYIRKANLKQHREAISRIFKYRLDR